MTPLQRYRARMRRLAEIATECGLHTIAGAFSVRALMPRRHIDRRCLSLLREWARDRGTWDPALPGALAAGLLLLSAADETEALLRAKGGAP